MLLFDDAGQLTEKFALAAGGPRYGLEIQPGVWHTLISEASGTLLVEIKPGPYAPLPEEDFAPWAPAEGEATAAGFAAALHALPVGKACPYNTGQHK